MRKTIGCMIGLLLAGSAFGQTITLKEKAYVSGPEVLLGDVAEVSGEDAEWLRTLPIAKAAMPGRATRVDAALVRSRLQREGVTGDGVRIQGQPKLLATTLATELTPEFLRRDLTENIERKMPWSPERAEVEVKAFSRPVVVADGTVTINWKPGADYAYVGPENFRGDVYVDGSLVHTLFARASIKAFGEILVATMDIPRGSAFTNNNVRQELREIVVNRGVPISDLQMLAGQMAKQNIRKGNHILPIQIAARILIKRNDIVPVEVISGSLTVRMRARAMESAAIGDVIVCQNVSSKESFSAVLRKDGILEVL